MSGCATKVEFDRQLGEDLDALSAVPLGRHQTVEERAFPPLTAELYANARWLEDDSPRRKAACRILGLAHCSPLKFAQRLGWRRTPKAALARLLYLHREALREEVSRNTGRADFWWEELHRQLRRMLPNHPCWAEWAAGLAGEYGETPLSDPAGLRARVLAEILLDTHFAFYNRFTTEEDLRPARATRHLKYVRAFVDCAGLAADDQQELSACLAPHAANALVANRQWDQAIAESLDLARRCPRRWEQQALVAYLHCHAASDYRSPASSKDEAGHDEAVVVGRYISGLEAFMAEFPDCEAAFEVMGRLHLLLALDLAKEWRPASALCALAKAMAYKPDWAKVKDEEQRIERSLRQLTGLAEDLRKQPSRTPAAQTICDETADGTGSRDRWRRSAEPERIEAARNRAKSNLLRLRSERYVPVLRPNDHAPRRMPDAVPFDFWLFSRRDLKAKSLALAGVAILCFAWGLSIYDRQATSQRADAFALLTKAENQLDDTAARAAIASFRTSRPLAWSDPRLARVDRIERELDGWPMLRKRNEAFCRLIVARADKKPAGSMDAAAAFLDSLPRNASDSRTAAVTAWYRQAFGDDFMTRGQFDSAVAAGLKRYAALTADRPGNHKDK